MSDEFAEFSQQRPPAQQPQSSQGAAPRKKSKPKRPAKATAALPDLTQLGDILKCLHQVDGGDMAHALKSVDDNGIAIFAEGNALRYVALPYETYNMLVANAEATKR